jgi:hypothetical protein
MTRLLEDGGGAARAADVQRLLGHRYLRRARSFEDVTALSGRVVGTQELPETVADQIRRAQVLLGRPVIACFGTGADILGFAVRRDPLIHLTTFDGWSQRTPSGIVLHQAPPRGPVVERDGILVTDPADTAVDLARSGPEIDVLAVLDAALRSGIAAETLAEASLRAERRRGVVRVRDWLPYADWRADSAQESRTRFRFLDAGLPAPDLQVTVAIGDGSFRYLDLGWKQARVGCDYDSEEFHSGDVLRKDRYRHNQLTDLGWRMYYATGADVRAPGALLAHLDGSLRAAGYEFDRQRVSSLGIPRPAGSAAELIRRPRLYWSVR